MNHAAIPSIASRVRSDRAARARRMALFAVLASMLVALFAGPALALTLKPYSADAVAAAQAKGEATALHFHADWCPTCAAQQKVLRDLEKRDTRAITVFVVDYDREKALRRNHQVRAQSTLIVFKGRKETGRVAGETKPVALSDALQTAFKR